MVTIKSFRKNKTSDGREFISLELQSGVEAVQSLKTGKLYLTARRCFISTTFDEQTAQELVGSKMEGTVARISCDPYDYTVKDTGEIIQLSHSYEYQPIDSGSVVTRKEAELV